MKKILIVLLALLCVGAAFAEGNPGVSIGAWGRGLFYVGSNGTDISGGTTASWGWNPRIGITIASTNSANIGFQIDMNGDGGGINAGDNQKIWAKLLDGIVTVQIGNFYDDTFRGNAAFGAWNWMRFAFMNGESSIFGRVGERSPANFEIAVSTSGFYGFVAATGILGGEAVISSDASMALLRNGQIGAGYTIPDIGVIRAQIIGRSTATGANISDIQAAFKLTAVKGLTVDVGVDVPMSKTYAGFTARIPLFASYNMGTITVNAEGSFTLAELTNTINGGVGADVDLGNGLGLNADVRVAMFTEDLGIDPFYGFAVGVTKGLGNGLIGVGVEATNSAFTGDGATLVPAAFQDLQWCIPVRLEYWF